MTTISRFFALGLLASSLGISACTSSAPPRVSSTPLTPDETRVYEHGVDFIATLGGLEGRWRDDWDKDLSVRIATADAIAIVTVKTVRTDTDPEHRVAHRLIASVDRVLSGDTRGKEVELSVREGVPGFASVNDGLTRIQGEPFIAYIKWFQEEGGRVAAHWHLSPASPEVVAQTEQAVSKKNGEQPKGKVIVHNN